MIGASESFDACACVCFSFNLWCVRVVAVLCAIMGRPRTYATSSAKKRAKQLREKQVPRARIYLGKSMDLWNKAKETVELGLGAGGISDAAFAKLLLDRLVICQRQSLLYFVVSVNV